MNSSIHLYTVYTRNIATVNQQQRLLHFSKGLNHYSESLARSLTSVRYSSFIAHVHGKCSANGKPSLCIDPERHRYPRQSRSWTQLYRVALQRNTTDTCTIDTAQSFSTRDENGNRFGIHGSPE